jgi:hypothetical protein
MEKNKKLKNPIFRDMVRVAISINNIDYLLNNNYYKKFSYVKKNNIKNIVFSYLNRLDNK